MIITIMSMVMERVACFAVSRHGCVLVFVKGKMGMALDLQS